jgi:hypothetical protein
MCGVISMKGVVVAKVSREGGRKNGNRKDSPKSV